MDSAEALIISDLLAGLDARQVAVLSRLAENPQGIPLAEVPRTVREGLARRMRMTLVADSESGLLRPRSQRIGLLLAEALRGGRHADGVCAVQQDTGGQRDLFDSMRAAQAHGDFDEALRLFRKGGGHFFMHFYGMEACQRAIEGFSEEMRSDDRTLVFAATMHALKAGNVSRARHLMARRFGGEANDLARVLEGGGHFALDFRLFRFLMAMYEDRVITDAMRERLFEALGEVPLDDHLQRGSFYNAMLEVFVRRRQFDAAVELAGRARHHYRLAEAHLLGFYIDLYLAILALMRGTLAAAETHAREAGETLRKVPFETKSDERILGLVGAVIRYEQGDLRSLVRFLNEEFDQFAYGEIWPTVAELAINYGGQALSRHIAIPAARVFLDKWRVQEWRSNRFRMVITLREVAILQSGNRWQEAADLLTAVQSRINRTWVEGAVDNLLRLVDPQEIALALAWLRHLIWEVPSRPMLRDQLAELLRNDHLTERQRITLLLWSAHLARQQRDVTAARAALIKALEASARLGSVIPLVDDAAMLERLLADKRIRQFALASGETRQVVRKVRAMEAPVSDSALKAGLTRQEMKVLLLVVEGGTNKYVARQLGLAEVTVKFHLSNVYRKIGCRRRGEAVAAAKALGWVA